MRTIATISLVFALGLMLIPGGLHAESNSEVVRGMGKKFARGVTNTAFGWTSYHGEIQERGATGLATGTVETITRTVVGAAELGTFLFPNPHVESNSRPRNTLSYDPYMKPVHPWE